MRDIASSEKERATLKPKAELLHLRSVKILRLAGSRQSRYVYLTNSSDQPLSLVCLLLLQISAYYRCDLITPEVVTRGYQILTGVAGTHARPSAPHVRKDLILV